MRKLKVQGFRAFMTEKEFTFDNPLVLLFGENHRGKSSALNAIEWCLFGNESIGKNTGIRERINWEILNRNLGSKPEVFAEIEFQDENKNSYRILRKWISKTKDALKITLPDCSSFEGEDAEKELAQILKS